MTLDELKALNETKNAPSERHIQIACVRWFKLKYRSFAPLLFSVPNGGSRHKLEAFNLKKEGLTAGVADLILLIPRGRYSSLCIEMKTQKGKQSPAQKEWQKLSEKVGNKYVICRNLEEFINEVNKYLNCA